MLKHLITGLGVWLMVSAAQAGTPEDTLYMDLKDGRVTIEMRPDLAPNHVARIKELVREGFYDGVVFHRVIDGFMAQTGDPTGTGMGGSGQKLKAEFSDAPHLRGVLSMARPGDVNGADSQFFIMLVDQQGLDGQYTVWGKVTEGMEHVDAIKKGDSHPASNGKVDNPDKMIRLQLASDAGAPKEEEQGANTDAQSDEKVDVLVEVDEPEKTATAEESVTTKEAAESIEAPVTVTKAIQPPPVDVPEAAPLTVSQEEIRPEDAEPAAGGNSQKVLYVPDSELKVESDGADEAIENMMDDAAATLKNISASPDAEAPAAAAQ